MRDQIAPAPGARRNLAGLVVPVILILAGVYAWISLLAGGAGKASLDAHAPWGIFIALFLFMESVAAGTLFLAALPSLWRTDDGTGRLAAVRIGVAAALCAGLAVLPDLSQPLQVWRLLFTPNPRSPMMLDVWFLGLTLILGVVLWWSLASKRRQVHPVAGGLLAAVAALLPVGTAWLFTSLQGRPGWTSSLEVAIFIAQALLTGAAVLYLLEVRSNWEQVVSPHNERLLVLVLVNALLYLGEIGLSLYQGGADAEPFIAMITGPTSWVFWAFGIAGLGLPALLSASRRAPAAAAGLALAGVALNKYLFIFRGNHVALPALPEGYRIPSMGSLTEGLQVIPLAFPTWREWLVVLCILSAGALLSGFGRKRGVRG